MNIKKLKGQNVYHKKKLKFQDYKNFLEAVQTENKINRLEKNKVEVNSLKEDKKKIHEKQ